MRVYLTRCFLIGAFGLCLLGSADAHVEHVRYYVPSDQADLKGLSFVLEKSLGNPEQKRLPLTNLQVAVTVDPHTDLLSPSLLAEGRLTVTFEADGLVWTVEPDKCSKSESLGNENWLFCVIPDAGGGFALEDTGAQHALTLHFGRIWKASGEPLDVSVTNGELAKLFINDSNNEDVDNRLVMTDPQQNLVSVPLMDKVAP